MRFHFTEDQLLLRDTVHDFLEAECTAEGIRALWETETGRSPEFWSSLAEVGMPGLLVPEEYDGMGMDEIDLVLLLEETGRAGLAEPVISTAAVGVPLLCGLDSKQLGERWLGGVAAGEVMLAVGHSVSPFVSDAHVADLLLLPHQDEIHAVSRKDASLTHQLSNDPSERIFSVQWKPVAETLAARGEEAKKLQAAALDRGALGCAAQQLGVAQRLVEMTVEYACQRKQFGKPIGSFQAIKHMLANVQVRLEYARPVVYRAAHSVARNSEHRSVDVSMAKSAASETAQTAAKVALQVYGALGYTWEQDLHIWMRRAWSLEAAWGSSAWHRARVADAILDSDAAAGTFGYSAPC
jgi:alkylation response protein AidB-like acyl-CoA dehydrogenase